MTTPRAYVSQLVRFRLRRDEHDRLRERAAREALGPSQWAASCVRRALGIERRKNRGTIPVGERTGGGPHPDAPGDARDTT